MFTGVWESYLDFSLLNQLSYIGLTLFHVLHCRMWEGGAYTALSVWVNSISEMYGSGEDLPQLATIVVV